MSNKIKKIQEKGKKIATNLLLYYNRTVNKAPRPLPEYF